MNDEFDLKDCSVFRTTNDPTLVNQIRYLKERVFLYLLFYVAEDYEGKNMLTEAAQTRFFNIRKKHCYNGITNKALCIPIQSIDEVVTQIPKIIEKHSEDGDKKVLVQEIGFFSHSGWDDGPVSYNTPIIICSIIPSKPNKHPIQMDMCGWEQIKVEWARDAKCVFYGCNTGNPKSKNFAQNILNLPNFKNVEIWGQPNYSYPSLYPDYRVTNIERIIDDESSGHIGENIYMVADNASSSLKRPYNMWQISRFGLYQDDLKQEQLENGGYTKALPMNCYKNGKFIKASHQGVFNDHR